MGNLSTDLINFLNDIGITNAEAIKPLADFIGLIGDVGGVVGGISSIINLVNQWQGTDQLTKITNAIGDVSTALGDYFHQLGQDEGASQILQRNSKLNDIIAGPSTQYGLLTNAMGKQLTSDEIKNYVQPCIYALNEFEGPAQPDLVWGVTFDWEIFWTDYGLYTNTCYNYPYVFSIDAGYGQRTPTKDGFGNVLYYTITLPVYLQAIWFFLAVAGALDPAFPQKYKPDLQSAANKLTNVYSDITTNGKGLTTLSPPNWSSAGLVNTPCPGATAESVGIRLVYQEPVNPTELVIQGALIEYGAVEKFSGCSSVCASYQINFDSASD